MNLTALFNGQPDAIFGIGYMDPTEVGILCMGLLLVLVICGVRVVFAAGIVGLVGLVELIGWNGAASAVGQIPFSKSVSFVLGLLPMFILIGYLAFHAGMTKQLFAAARAWIGWVPGGLAAAPACTR